MKRVALFTDGACRGNPGPGGWGVLLRYGDHERELYGGEPATTNNRMELRAAIEGLKALREPWPKRTLINVGRSAPPPRSRNKTLVEVIH